MSQALYRKWRPRRWEDVVGQQHVVQTLRNAITAGKVAHAFLFAGPRGTGKTTTARLLAKAVNCLSPNAAERPCDACDYCTAVNQGRFLDLIEIDAASNTSVEDVRDLRDKINFSPNQGQFKVYIIDEVHMLSTAAFNALLKTLEEPPPHAIFILATTEAHRIPATVLSRCQRHEFRRIPVAEIVSQLKAIAAGEDLTYDEPGLAAIARQSTGCMRDAISLLDQIASSGLTINLQNTQNILGTAANQTVLDLIDDVLAGEMGQGLGRIAETLDQGSDPRQLARQVVDYLRDLLLVRSNNADALDLTAEMRQRMAGHAQKFGLPHLLLSLRAFNQAASEGRNAWQPSLLLEMAFVEATLNEAPAPSEPRPAAAESTAAAPVRTAPAQKSEAPSGTRQPARQAAASAENASDEDGKALFPKVQEGWNNIKAQLQNNSKAQGLINTATLAGVRNHKVVLVFTSQILCDMLMAEDEARAVRQAVHKVTGLELGLHCQVGSPNRKKLPPGVDQDGMVATAVQDLGGEIVDVQ